MAEETNVIREQIEETRHSLTENLASLEERIKRTVETAKTTVDDTIEHAKQKFSPTYHTQKRPLVMVGGTLAAGFLAGTWLGKRNGGPRYYESSPSFSGESFSASPSVTDERRAFSLNRGPSWIKREFGDELGIVKGILLSSIVKGVGEKVKEAMPDYREKIEQLVDSAVAKFDK